ncbi:acyloxyacyl hydrolase, partial [Arthrospira platensis SPKY1]|nr:acyloxyacyl hydrolase [Arthrospira platensis SPKY1]
LALSAHMNFYFLKKRLQLRVAQGLARNSNPYNRETNFRNNAFGQQWMSANTFMLRYNQPLSHVPISLHAGLVFTHFSNGRFQFPNRGLNTYGVHAGIQYHTKKHEYTIDT